MWLILIHANEIKSKVTEATQNYSDLELTKEILYIFIDECKKQAKRLRDEAHDKFEGLFHESTLIPNKTITIQFEQGQAHGSVAALLGLVHNEFLLPALDALLALKED